MSRLIALPPQVAHGIGTKLWLLARLAHLWLAAEFSPAKVAGVERFIRYLGYQLFGWIIINAAALSANLLLSLHFGTDAISAGTFLVTAAAAGVKRSAAYQRYVDTTTLTTLPMPPGSTASTVAIITSPPVATDSAQSTPTNPTP